MVVVYLKDVVQRMHSPTRGDKNPVGGLYPIGPPLEVRHPAFGGVDKRHFAVPHDVVHVPGQERVRVQCQIYLIILRLIQRRQPALVSYACRVVGVESIICPYTKPHLPRQRHGHSRADGQHRRLER